MIRALIRDRVTGRLIKGDLPVVPREGEFLTIHRDHPNDYGPDFVQARADLFGDDDEGYATFVVTAVEYPLGGSMALGERIYVGLWVDSPEVMPDA